MILNDDEVQERMESPINLLNRLRNSLSKATIIPSVHPPQTSNILPPRADDIIPDLEDKITTKAARTKALSLMLTAMNELEARMPEVKKPESLAKIAYDMSRAVSAQSDSRYDKSASMTSQIIVYAPQVQSLDNFEIIDVKE